MSSRGGISLLALIAIGAGTPAAGAPAGRFVVPVDFDSPAGCSGVAAFRRALATRLGEGGAAAGVTRLQVRIVRAGNKVLGELRLFGSEDATDTRRVEGTRCREVVEVLAFTAALALQPMVGRPEASAIEDRASVAPSARLAAPREAPVPRSTPSRPSAAPPSATAGDPPSPAAPVAATVERSAPARPVAATPPAVADVPRVRPTTAGWRLDAVAGFALAHVLSPGFNLGPAFAVGVARQVEHGVAPSLRLMFLYLPDDLLLPAGDVTATWRALALSACPGWGLRSGAFQAQACARATGGWLALEDRAVTNRQPASRALASAGIFLRGGAAIGEGFSVEIEAGLDAALVERRFITTTPPRTVADTPPVSVLVGIGLSHTL